MSMKKRRLSKKIRTLRKNRLEDAGGGKAPPTARNQRRLLARAKR